MDPILRFYPQLGVWSLLWLKSPVAMGNKGHFDLFWGEPFQKNEKIGAARRRSSQLLTFETRSAGPEAEASRFAWLQATALVAQPGAAGPPAAVSLTSAERGGAKVP